MLGLQTNFVQYFEFPLCGTRRAKGSTWAILFPQSARTVCSCGVILRVDWRVLLASAFPGRSVSEIVHKTMSARGLILNGGKLPMVAGSSAPPALLQPNRHQGYFAEALVASISAAAGLDVYFPRLGDKADLQIYTPGPGGTSSSRQICIQVKSWCNPKGSEQYYNYPLEVPAYNHLAGPDHDVRHYLALCIVPPGVDNYADAQPRRLHLRCAAYWLSLRSEQPDHSLNSNSTKTVYVPKTHLITPATIRALVDRDEAMAVVA